MKNILKKPIIFTILGMGSVLALAGTQLAVDSDGKLWRLLNCQRGLQIYSQDVATQAYADSRAGSVSALALKIANNLSDLDSADSARANLGLGDAATKSVGSASGTVAAGDHAHTGVYIPVSSIQTDSSAAGSDTEVPSTAMMIGYVSEHGGSGGGTGDVTGPASAASGNLASYADATGKTIADSGVSASGVSAHIASTSNPHSVTASQTGAIPAPPGAAQGDLLYHTGSAWARLAAGSSGQFLKTLGSGANPAWDSVSAANTIDLSSYTAADSGKFFKFNVAADAVTSGGLAKWTLANSLADSFGSYTLANSGVTFSTDSGRGGAYVGVFNGSSYASFSQSGLPSGSSARTVTAWIKGSGTGQTFISWGSGNGGVFGLRLADSGYLGVTVGGGDYISSTSINDSAWHHVAVTYNSSALYFYIDNQLVHTASASLATSLGTTGYLGSYFGSLEFWSGSLSDVRVYNRALSVSEISKIYSGETGSNPTATLSAVSDAPAAADVAAGNFGLAPIVASGAVTGGGAAKWTLANSLADSFGSYTLANSGVTFSTDSGRGGAYVGVFNGSSYASFSQSGLPSGSSARTVTAWIKGSGTGQTFFSYGTGTGSVFGLRFAASGYLGVTIASGDYISSTAINDGNWRHAAVVYTGSVLYFYVDGQLAHTVSASLNTNVASTGYIGSYLGTLEFFNGSISDLRVYNRALAAAEISLLYTGEPSAAWTFPAASAASLAGTERITLTTSSNTAVTKTLDAIKTFCGSLDISGLTAITAPAQADYFPVYSAANNASRKILLGDMRQAIINAQTGTTYTLVLTDAGKTIISTNASAQTITVPLNSSVAFPIGTVINVIQGGAGATTIAGASGVTVNGTSGGDETITGQFKPAALLKTGTDTWIILGSI